MSPTSYQAAPPRITVLIERGEGCPIYGRPSRMFLLCYFLDDFCTTGRYAVGGAGLAVAGAAVYLAIRRPMRGTAASTCFLPVGRSFS